MPQIGPAEILVILLVGMLVFGPKRLPEIGRQVGRGIRELRRFQETVKGELHEVLHFDEDHDSTSSTAASATERSVAEAPPALPAATTDPAPPTMVRPASHAPSRFRAPGPRPTT